MQLIVFCHESIGYLVPNKVVELAKQADIDYENGDIDAAIQVINDIKSKYKPIIVGRLFTGDI